MGKKGKGGERERLDDLDGRDARWLAGWDGWIVFDSGGRCLMRLLFWIKEGWMSGFCDSILWTDDTFWSRWFGAILMEIMLSKASA